MKKFIIVFLSMLIVFTFTSCKTEIKNATSASESEILKTSDTNSQISSEKELLNVTDASTADKTLNNSSQNSSVTNNTSSKKSEDSSKKKTSSKNKEISSKTTSKKSTSSKSSTSSKHTHKYYRPQNHWKYIGDGLWDGSGWRDEKTRGVVFPTCTEKGFTVYVCSSCGHVKYDDYVKATGHDFSKKASYVYPGYKTKGYAYYKCENDDCEEIKKGEKFPARKGDLSGIDSKITFKRGGNCDSYTLKGDDYISISDCRTWGSMPTITVNKKKKYIIIKYDLEDGTINEEKIDFPSKASPNKKVHYNGVINPINTDDDGLCGGYYSWSWDGAGTSD